MQSFEIKIPKPKSGDEIEIFSICCLHIGHRNHNREHALKYRDYILNTPNAYVYNLGDDTENAIPGDEKHNSMMWDQIMTPDQQFIEACEYWLPLAEAGKILVTHDSNHWYRSEAKTGRSQAAELNQYLAQNSPKGKAPKWGRWQAFAKIVVGKQIYLVHSWHGAGGGSTPEGALRKCRAKAMEHHADVFLMGHSHKRIAYQDPCKVWSDDAGGVVDRLRSYLATGCFMDWDGGYGERMGLPPALTGAGKITLNAKDWGVGVYL